MTKKLCIFSLAIAGALLHSVVGMEPAELEALDGRNRQLLEGVASLEFRGTPTFSSPLPEVTTLGKRRQFTFHQPEAVKAHLDDFQIHELLDSCSEELLNNVYAINYLKKHPIASVDPINRILLLGPKGSGKSSLPLAIAYKTQKRWILASASELSDEYKNSFVTIIDDLFDPAIKSQEDTLIALDEISGFTKRQNGSSQVDPGAVEYLLTKLDRCRMNKNLLVMFTDNTTDNIPGTLLDRLSVAKFYIDHPRTPARRRLVINYLSPFCTAEDEYWQRIAIQTEGFSLRELNALVDKAKQRAVGHLRSSSDPAAAFVIEKKDIDCSLKSLLKDHHSQLSKEQWEYYKETLKTLTPYAIQLINMGVSLYLQKKFHDEQMSLNKAHHNDNMLSHQEHHKDTMDMHNSHHGDMMKLTKENANRSHLFAEWTHEDIKAMHERHFVETNQITEKRYQETQAKEEAHYKESNQIAEKRYTEGQAREEARHKENLIIGEKHHKEIQTQNNSSQNWNLGTQLGTQIALGGVGMLANGTAPYWSPIVVAKVAAAKAALCSIM